MYCWRQGTNSVRTADWFKKPGVVILYTCIVILYKAVNNKDEIETYYSDLKKNCLCVIS